MLTLKTTLVQDGERREVGEESGREGLLNRKH